MLLKKKKPLLVKKFYYDMWQEDEIFDPYDDELDDDDFEDDYEWICAFIDELL